MKKTFLFLLVTGMLLISQPLFSAVNISTPEASKPVESDKAKVLLLRLEEIKAMDKTGLTPADKKELRREVHTIKKELQQMHGGVYISVGAIIIIALLLIILL